MTSPSPVSGTPQPLSAAQIKQCEERARECLEGPYLYADAQHTAETIARLVATVRDLEATVSSQQDEIARLRADRTALVEGSVWKVEADEEDSEGWQHWTPLGEWPGIVYTTADEALDAYAARATSRRTEP